MNLVLQKRDRELLAGIRDHHFMPIDVVHRFFFKGTSERRARQRVQQLEAAGLIKPETGLLLQKRKVLRLTDSGLKLSALGHPHPIFSQKKINPVTFHHDALVMQVRYRLQEFWDAVWIPEHELKESRFEQIPDGAFYFANGKKAVVEIENSAKGPKRFRKILDYWRETDIELILYVASTESLFRLVREYIAGARPDPSLALVQWQKLESGKPVFWTQTREIDLLSRRQL